MALMLSKTYDAFKAAGAPDDKAREAAEEIAGFEDRLHGVESDVKLVKWMVGFNLALSMAIVALSLQVLAR
ncbi:MAG: integrase [Acidobacteria bacterium]|nr:integrase [Acidobacteriota bacterium]